MGRDDTENPLGGNGMPILGIGTDIVEVVRIGQMIERHGEVFLQRVYTATASAARNTRSTSPVGGPPRRR
jgi:hypothetical protein